MATWSGSGRRNMAHPQSNKPRTKKVDSKTYHWCPKHKRLGLYILRKSVKWFHLRNLCQRQAVATNKVSQLNTRYSIEALQHISKHFGGWSWGQQIKKRPRVGVQICVFSQQANITRTDYSFHVPLYAGMDHKMTTWQNDACLYVFWWVWSLGPNCSVLRYVAGTDQGQTRNISKLLNGFLCLNDRIICRQCWLQMSII